MVARAGLTGAIVVGMWLPALALPGLVLAVLVAGLASPARADAGSRWTWPVAPPHLVVHRFDPPAHDWLPGHRGVDLAAEQGAPVVAAGAGTITFAGAIAGVGVVAVRHAGGLVTTYEPVRATVHRGDPVRQGQQLGSLAHGGHCLPSACLHWGLRRGRTYLDPLGLVGAGRVRLLPVLSGRSPRPWLRPTPGGASVGGWTAVLVWAARIRRRRRRRRDSG